MENEDLLQQELRRHGNHLENILKSMFASLVVTDTDGRIRMVNEATLEMLEYSLEEIVGLPLDHVCRGGDSSDAGDVAALLRLESVVRREAEYARKDGTLIPVLFTSSVLHDAEKRADGIVCIALDITERKQSEEALRQAELKYRNIYEGAPEGIYQTTTDGRFISANPAMARLHGFDSPERMIEEVSDIGSQLYVHPDRRRQFVEQIQKNGSVAMFESELRRQDGSIRWIRESARAVPDNEGEVLYYEGTVEDITERKRARDDLERSRNELAEANRQLRENQTQLLQSEKLAVIGQLAAGVAHEINNPVGFVLSNMGTLAEYADSLVNLLSAYKNFEDCVQSGVPEKVFQALESLRQQKEAIDLDFILEDLESLVAESADGAERVGRIVQNLRDFSHLDRQQRMPTDINAGIDSTLNIIWNELKYKVQIEKDYGDFPEVVCFPMELNQVFMNLLMNSAQAIEDRGTIAIKTYRQEDFVYVAISDTGNGMSPEVQQRIFEPFFTTKEVGEGTGLGLSMCHTIIADKHGGEITCESERGKGTTFTLKIPVGDNELF